MRAVVHDRYGPPEVLRVEDVERPVPAADEVLVRVHATTVTQTDCHMRRARPLFWRFMLGFRRPRRRTLGLEFAGVVEALGSSVTHFAIGDRVFGMKRGSHAEYVCVREAGLIARMPDAMGFEQAAAVCDGYSQAVNTLRAGRVGEGTNLLIYGGTGSLGTGAVQLAAQQGADVTAVCKGRDAAFVLSLGADRVIDYEREDFTKSGTRYDVIIDAVGKHSYLRARHSLQPGGIFVATDRLFHLPLALATRWFGSTRVAFDFSGYRREDVLALGELLEAGRYRAIVDRVYPLDDVVAASHYVDSWQKVGNVVLSLNGTQG
jgi:NADPH:quinone reductase-like Zn-dependent oxidoreductase